MNTMKTTCPKCSRVYSVPSTSVGKTATCKQCSSRFVVAAGNCPMSTDAKVDRPQRQPTNSHRDRHQTNASHPQFAGALQPTFPHLALHYPEVKAVAFSDIGEERIGSHVSTKCTHCQQLLCRRIVPDSLYGSVGTRRGVHLNWQEYQFCIKCHPVTCMVENCERQASCHWQHEFDISSIKTRAETTIRNDIFVCETCRERIQRVQPVLLGLAFVSYCSFPVSAWLWYSGWYPEKFFGFLAFLFVIFLGHLPTMIVGFNSRYSLPNKKWIERVRGTRVETKMGVGNTELEWKDLDFETSTYQSTMRPIRNWLGSKPSETSV